MKTFKLLAAPLALALGLGGIAAPASAQVHHSDSRAAHSQVWRLSTSANAQIRQDINQLRQAVNRSNRNLSFREQSGLRTEVARIQSLYSSYSRGGLTRAEVATLQTRINHARTMLRLETRDYNNWRG